MEYVVVKKVNLYDSEAPGTGKTIKALKVGSVIIVEEIKKIGRRSIVSESVERAKVIAPFEGWCNILTYKGEPLIQPVTKSSSSFSDASFRTNRFYYGDVGNDLKFSKSSLGLAVNEKWIVYPRKEGDLGILPLNISKNYVKKSAQDVRRGTYGVVDYSSAPKTLKTDNVVDFGFNPFELSNLTTLHGDGVVKTWKMDIDDVKDEIVTPKCETIEEGCAGSAQLRYHPSAKNVCAVGRNICDIGQSKVLMSCFCEDMNPIPIGWEYDGSRLYGAKQNSLFWADPRSNEKAESTKLTLIAEFVMAGGQFNMLLTGCNNLRDRIITCYDIRNMAEPIETKYIKDHKLDPIVPLYDPDTMLLWVAFKNDNILQLYDLNNIDENGFVSLNVDQKSQLGLEFEAMAQPPKTVFGSKEFGHIIKLTNNDKIYQTSVSLDVQAFKDKTVPQAKLNAEEWKSGKNGAPTVNRRSKFLRAKKDEGAKKQRSLFHHLGIYEAAAKESIVDCPVWNGCLPCGKNIQVNRDYVIFTSKTVGPGNLGIATTSQKGRVGYNLKCIKSHSGQPLFDISKFSNVVLTAGTDCKANVWSLPDKVKEDIVKPEVTRGLEGRALYAGFHPYVAGIAFISNKSIGKSKFRMVDDKLQDIVALDLAYDVTNVSYHPEGYLLALCCSDQIVRVLDIRNQKIVQEIKTEEMVKPHLSSVYWLDDNRLLVMGHRKGSVIGISVWDHNGKQLMAWELDKSNSIPIGHWDPDLKIFFQACIGEARIRFYEIKKKTAKETGISRTLGFAIRGMAYASKHDVDFRNVELNKAFTMADGIINPVSFQIPRKRKTYFQDDLFCETRSREPLMAASDFIAGKVMKPVFVSLCPKDMQKLSEAPPEELTDRERVRLAKKAEMEMKNRDEREAKEGDIARSWDRMMGGVMANFDHEAPRVGETEVDDGIDSDEWSD